MIRAIVWKEFREQGLIGLTLLVFGSGILVAAATLADPPTAGAGFSDVIRSLGAGLVATLLLAVTAGTVCGGAVFAAEREAGTIGFLESLPVSRWRLWRAKFAAGLLLVGIEVGIVLAVSSALDILPSPQWGLAIGTYALLAFVWGLYGSTVARTTLGSVGIAVPSAAAAFLLCYLPVALLYANPGTNLLDARGAYLLLGLMFAAPIGGSAWRFTREDRARAADDPTPAPFDPDGREPAVHAAPVVSSQRWLLGLRAILWLVLKQLWLPGLAIAGFAAVCGLAMLAPTVQPIVMWPGLALAAGVLASVTAFVDEQSHGCARFWGERRIPVGRLWLVKIAVHAAFAILLAGILLLPSIIRVLAASARSGQGPFLSAVFRTMLFDKPQIGSQAWSFVALPLVYGFASGCVCSLLFRKAVVAAGVAGLVGAMAGAFWLPSLFAGGVHAWQLWLPPALALFTAYRLMRDWAADRLTARPLIAVLGSGLAAILVAIAAGLADRVLEIPDDPASEDDIEYVMNLPAMETIDSGRSFRTAAERYTRVLPGIVTTPDHPEITTGRGSLNEKFLNTPYLGWNGEFRELGDWMNQVYAPEAAVGEEPWFVQAERAANDPPGLFEHPIRAGAKSSVITQMNGRAMGTALIVHGLQKQAEGDPAPFPKDLRTALALSRAYRNGSVVSALMFGHEIDRNSFAGTDHWLAALSGRPDLVRLALTALQEDDPSGPFDPRPHLLAERFVLRELEKAPSQWLPALITPPDHDPERVAAIVDFIGTAWSVPWERERTRRLMGVGFEAGNRSEFNRRLIRGRPGINQFTLRGQSPVEMTETDRHHRAHRRAMLIALALRLHELETGGFPASLNDLVAAGYLPSIPIDPYDEQPFRYRLSVGEMLRPAPSPSVVQSQGPGMPMGPARLPLTVEPRLVVAGRPIIWCVGIDRTDDGGHNLPTQIGIMGGGKDLVFLPPPQVAKP